MLHAVTTSATFFDIVIIAETDKDLHYWPIKVKELNLVLETVVNLIKLSDLAEFVLH